MGLTNDEPTLIDLLNQSLLIEEIGGIVGVYDPPQVFGLHGDWGLGKTSLLHQLQLFLTNDCPQQPDKLVNQARRKRSRLGLKPHPDPDKFRVVWFEAWRYQHEQAPVVALLHEMREQLAWYQKVTSRGKKLLNVAVRGALLSMEDLTKKIGIQASKIEQAGTDWEREHLAARLPSHTIREQLALAINGLLTGTAKREDRRVVVLIDDLDRCEPEAAYRLIEGLKIYLTLPNCVFLLGMNQRIVEDAIARHVPVTARDDQLAAEIRKERATAYLEKLCQTIWRVPSVRRPGDLLGDFLKQSLGPAVTRDWILKGVGDGSCVPPNPRRIKALANLLTRFQKHLPTQIGKPDDASAITEARKMLVVALIYQFHHDIHRRWVHNPTFYRHIYEWSLRGKDAPWFTTELGDCFRHLRRPSRITIRETTATPEPPLIESAFPDPAESTVFWAQPLIAELGNLDPSQFTRYLYGEHGKK